MEEEKARALFLLACIDVRHAHRLENKYWPDAPVYAQIRRDNPWWLIETPFGPIEIGWRKRVISIRWESTKVRAEITEDDVTKSETMVHAWGYLKALEYLSALSSELRKAESSNAIAQGREHGERPAGAEG